jgi:hypothetical protein
LSDSPPADRRVTLLEKHKVYIEGKRRLSVRAAVPIS